MLLPVGTISVRLAGQVSESQCISGDLQFTLFDLYRCDATVVVLTTGLLLYLWFSKLMEKWMRIVSRVADSSSLEVFTCNPHLNAGLSLRLSH